MEASDYQQVIISPMLEWHLSSEYIIDVQRITIFLQFDCGILKTPVIWCYVIRSPLYFLQIIMLQLKFNSFSRTVLVQWGYEYWTLLYQNHLNYRTFWYSNGIHLVFEQWLEYQTGIMINI